MHSQLALLYLLLTSRDFRRQVLYTRGNKNVLSSHIKRESQYQRKHFTLPWFLYFRFFVAAHLRKVEIELSVCWAPLWGLRVE